MLGTIREIVDEVVLVSEGRVVETIRQLASGNRIVVEGSAALSVAAAVDMASDKRGLSVCVVTGGSIDTDKLIKILSS